MHCFDQRKLIPKTEEYMAGLLSQQETVLIMIE